MTQPDTSLFSAEHLALWASIVGPLGSGIVWLIWKQAQNQLKIDWMWDYLTNHISDQTGYRPGDERKRK